MAVSFMRASATVVFLAALCTTAIAADELPFEAKAVVAMDITAEGQKQALVANTSFGYTWKFEKPDQRTLSLDSMALKMSVGDEPQMDFEMSRKGMTRMVDGEKVEERFENSSPAVQKLLTELFGTPMCRMQVDKFGKAMKVEVLPNPSLQKLGQTDIIDIALFGHPEPPAGREQWTTESRLSSGKGGVVSGSLQFTKERGRPDATRYLVSGKLSNPLIKTPEGQTVKDSLHVVSGHLVFDEARKMWMGGDITLDMSFKLLDGEEQAEAKGTMKLTIQPRKVKAEK